MSSLDYHLRRARDRVRSLAQLLNPARILSGLKQLNELELMALELEFIRTHMSAYLGNGIALTHLLDETPIYVNSNDYGPPANYINGGRYENDVLAVLLSFVRDDTVFLDVGANVGYYALQIGRRVGGHGKVHAFEPHPMLREMVKRSTHLNGLSATLELHPYGLSDENATRLFAYPRGHLGGGGVNSGESQRNDEMFLHVKRLDDVFDASFVCDLMKIDVEGHELFVLKGMPQILQRSPHIKILFENFQGGDPAPKRDVDKLLRQAGLSLYGVGYDSCLTSLPDGALEQFDGYVLAARAEDIGNDFDRLRFAIYPRQMFVPGVATELTRDRLVNRGDAGTVLFYGPYWLLPRGGWRLRVEGDLGTGIELTIATRTYHIVRKVKLTNKKREVYFRTDRDLVHFECVGRALKDGTQVAVERIELSRA